MAVTVNGASPTKAQKADLRAAFELVPATAQTSAANPIIVAHRNAPMMWPENSLQGARALYAAGIRHIEVDVQRCQNGGLIIMHDSDVSRTTNGAGAINSLTVEQVRGLVVDHMDSGAGCSAPGYAREQPPMLSELLDWAADKPDLVLVIEPKDDSCEQIIAELRIRNWPTDRVIFETTADNIGAALADGWQCWRISFTTTPSTAYIDETAAQGYSHIAFEYPYWTAPLVTYAKGKGLKTMAFTLNRRHQYASLKAMGVEYIVSDDPIYLAWGEASKRWTKSRHGSAKFAPGMLSGRNAVTNDITRGKFDAPNGLHGWATAAQADNVLHGYLCPIKGDASANSFTITGKLKFVTVAEDTRNLQVFVCAGSDEAFTDTLNYMTGYNVLFRRNGTVQIYRVDRTNATTGTSTSIASQTGTALTLTQVYDFTITVTPTQVSASCNGVTATAADANYRGGYLHTGRNGCEGYLRIDNVT